MKKVLVTGGAGFIGSNLINELLKMGYNVTSIDDYSRGSSINHLANVNYINICISEISTINDKFDICFHLAAKTLVSQSFEYVEDYFRVNVSGTQHVVDWASKNNTKLIYAGSASRHNDVHSSPYALTKYLGEEICRLYKINFNLSLNIARFYNVYGPRETVDEVNGNVIGIWRSQVKKDKPLTIVGDGNQTRDFIHVKDISKGLIKIAESNLSNEDAWELGSGFQYSINKLFTLFKNRFPEIQKKMMPDQPGNFKESIRVNDHMIKKLNWKPEDRLEDYILTIK